MPLFILIVLAGCGGESRKYIQKIKIILSSEGPLYSGPNTATGKWMPDAEFAGKVKSLRFTSVRLSSSDTSLSTMIQNPVLQMAASQADMKKVAYLKGGSSGNDMDLKLADDQSELKDFFNGQEITFVLDYDLIPEERNENLPVMLEFEAEMIID